MSAMANMRVLVILAMVVMLYALFELTRPPSAVHPQLPHATHPITQLMADAETQFRQLLSRQSASLPAAVAEYRRRYARAPPRGFDEWFAFARAHDVKMIDEYDGMMRDFEPFWALSGEEIRRRAMLVGYLPSIDLVRLQNGTTMTMSIPKKYNDSEGGARAQGFCAMMDKFQHKLPDMYFPINTKAEGRILVPWEHKMYPNTSQQDSSIGLDVLLGGEFYPDWRGDGNVWEAFRKTCSPDSQARRLFGAVRPRPSSPNGQQPQQPQEHLSFRFRRTADTASPADEEAVFAARPDDTFDFCQHPWARYQHGHFFSDWRTLPVLLPVFSPAKAPGFADLLIPSHYYYFPTSRYTYGWDAARDVVREVDEGEVPWEAKTSRVFWRGATTGGGSNPRGFLTSYQRHRFVEMAAGATNATTPIVFPTVGDPEQRGLVAAPAVPIAALNDEIMDVAFTKGVGCQGFKPKSQQPGQDEALRGDSDDIGAGNGSSPSGVRETGCAGLRRAYNFSVPVPMAEHWRHKYLVDVDGMGYSARSMAFLASDSAMMKATVYREFYTEWIQPWLHYIPLSQSYKEIYNIHAYFSGASRSMVRAASESAGGPAAVAATGKAGDRRLRRIARAGRQWKHSIARKADMEAYVYRLCLEYARLWADDREEMSYSLPSG